LTATSISVRDAAVGHVKNSREITKEGVAKDPEINNALTNVEGEETVLTLPGSIGESDLVSVLLTSHGEGVSLAITDAHGESDVRKRVEVGAVRSRIGEGNDCLRVLGREGAKRGASVRYCISFRSDGNRLATDGHGLEVGHPVAVKELGKGHLCGDERTTEVRIVGVSSEVDIRSCAVGNVGEVDGENLFGNDALAVHDLKGTRKEGADGHGNFVEGKAENTVEVLLAPRGGGTRKSVDTTEVHDAEISTTNLNLVHGQGSVSSTGSIGQEKEARFLTVDLGGALVLKGGGREVVVAFNVATLRILSRIAEGINAKCVRGACVKHEVKSLRRSSKTCRTCVGTSHNIVRHRHVGEKTDISLVKLLNEAGTLGLMATGVNGAVDLKKFLSGA